MIADRYPDADTHAHVAGATAEQQHRQHQDDGATRPKISSHHTRAMIHVDTFCSTRTAPDGSAMIAMVPSRIPGDTGNSTLPPRASARDAAAAGSSTPR